MTDKNEGEMHLLYEDDKADPKPSINNRNNSNTNLDSSTGSGYALSPPEIRSPGTRGFADYVIVSFHPLDDVSCEICLEKVQARRYRGICFLFDCSYSRSRNYIFSLCDSYEWDCVWKYPDYTRSCGISVYWSSFS